MLHYPALKSLFFVPAQNIQLPRNLHLISIIDFQRFPGEASVSNQLDRGRHSGDIMTAVAKNRAWRLIVPMFPPFVALAFQLLLWSLIDPYVWFLFYPAVFISSWMGGLGAGLRATAISIALVLYFFVPPEHSFVGKDVKQFFPASVFLGMGVMFAIFHDRLRTANQQVAESLAASKAAIDKLHEANARSERLRREQSAELTALLDSVPMPVFTAHDPDCLHITGNRAADQLLRNSPGAEASLSAPEQSKPRHFRAFKDGRELNNDELPAQRAARGISVHDFEFTLVFDDGMSREMLAYGTPLWNDEQRVRGSINVLVDITELKHAMKALQAREAQLHSFVQQAPASIAMFDQNMVCLAASRHWTSSFGRGHGELVGLSHYDVHPDLPEHWKAIHQRGLGGEFLSNDEDRWVQADGTQFWLSWAVRPWLNADGKIGGIMIMTADISQRKRAELALRDQEALARSVLDSMTAQVAVLDRAGQIVRVNVAWERFGRENGLTELVRAGVGTRYLEFCQSAADQGDDIAAAALQGLRGILDGRIPSFSLEYPCHSETEDRWFLLSIAPAIPGAPWGAVVSHIQITDRKRAEAAIKDREERMRAILNTAADAIITIDQRGFITSVNPATTGMFGYSQEELIGHNVKILMPAPYREDHDAYLARYVRTGEARVIGIGREVVGRRKDGTTFPVDLAVSQVDHLGLFTGIIRDISHQKELQKQVLEIAAEEQRRIGQELHDGTGQELTGLTLFAGTLVDLLTKAPQKTTDGKATWLLDDGELIRLRQTANRLTQELVEANRHVQQLSHGIMPVQIDVEGLRSALEVLAAATNGHQNITCHFECPEPITVANNTMATHLYRIAQEAVNNALKHSRADQIHIALTQQDGDIVLEVSDNGVGFDPGSVVRSSVSGGSKGFGLEIMNYRAGMIGGTLRVSRRDQGCILVRCVVPLKGLTA